MDLKEDLLDRIATIVGFEPPGARHLLRVLAHPDVIDLTKEYFESMDKNSMCLTYEYPWNCAREAEARYENIQFGWLGGGSGVGYSEWWCDNCRKKIIGAMPKLDDPEEVRAALDILEKS